MQRFRLWLRGWLGIVDPQPFPDLEPLRISCAALQSEIRELRAEVTRLSIAQYVPPQQPEPERKVIRTQTFKQFMDIVEQEQEELIRKEETYAV